MSASPESHETCPASDDCAQISRTEQSGRHCVICDDGDARYNQIDALRDLMRRDQRFEWVDLASIGAAAAAAAAHTWVLVRRRGSVLSRESQDDAKLRALLESDSIPQYIWPAASPLQQWVADHRDMFTGRTVLELGCGTGIVGFTVAPYAKQVVLTDVSAVSLAMTAESLARKKLQNCCVAALSWGRADQMAHIKRVCHIDAFDIVIGSDVFYFSNALKSGLVTARSAFEPRNSNESVFLCGSVARSDRMEADLEEMPPHEGFELQSFVADGPFHLYCWRLARPGESVAP